MKNRISLQKFQSLYKIDTFCIHPSNLYKMTTKQTTFANQVSYSETEILYKKIMEERQIREYAKQYKDTFLMTTRFNTHTGNENSNYRKTKWPKGCIYGTPVMVCKRIPAESKLFILEMQNDENRIIGIGLALNKPYFNKYKIYSDTNYNRFSYIGKYRISREEMSEEEEIVMKILDKLCFEGKCHMKRGHGLTAFPMKILYRCRNMIDLVKSVEEMFKKRIIKPS
jgi:hypothetical protein